MFTFFVQLSAEQRNEMCDYRQQAVQLELDRQSQHKNKLLARVQDIVDQVQVSGTLYSQVQVWPGGERQWCCENIKCAFNIINTTAVEEEMVKKEEKSDEEDEEDDISLDSLLKKSREYVKREQGQKVVHTVTRTLPPDSVPDTDNVSCSPMRDSGIEFGFSLHHSPTGPPQTQIQHQTLFDPSLQQSGCLSPSLPDWNTRLPSPESTVSPHVQRRRPRPVSTGNIHISFPVGPADLIPRGPGRSGERVGVADCGEPFSGARGSTDHWGSLGSDCGDSVQRGGSRRSSHCGTSPVQEICSPISTSGSSPSGPLDHLTTGFRRRCHTLDSQLHTYNSAESIDRSQERIPRFMAGVTWLGPGRRAAAAPLNQSYDIENPSPYLMRPRVTSDLSQVKVRMEPDDPQGLNNTRVTQTALRNASEAQVNTSEETQRRAQALEDMQRRLQEEHALQMSCLLAEQEQEQHRLRLVNICNCMICTITRVRISSSLVLTSEQQKAFCRISAITRGFLTRRLLKTEKVKHLRQTIVDTQEFIHSFQTEASVKKCNYSAQDLSLQERVRAQLRAALYDIHEIFFQMPLEDRLGLLQQDRELRVERNDMTINSLHVISFLRVLKPNQGQNSPVSTSVWFIMPTQTD
uniref:Centriolar coiled-coil protein 110 n=1 Tax=Sphaeramia orbicularis TaxID=375764 RepID=A0A673BSD7_9TELE